MRLSLTAAQRRFLSQDLCLGAGIFNFLLNYAIAWLLFRHLVTVPLWGEQSIGGDTLVTSVVLPFLTCLIVGLSTRSQIAKGRFSALALGDASPPLRWIGTHPTWLRGLLFGVLSALLIGLPTILVVEALGIGALPGVAFLWFKASYAGLLAALVTPAIGWVAMHR